MEKKEQDILRQIDEKTKDINVPDSLSPDAVKATLEERSRKVKRWRPTKAAGLAAACLVFVLGVTAAAVWSYQGDRQVQSHKPASSDISEEIARAKDYDQIYAYIDNYNNQQHMVGAAGETMEDTQIIKESAQARTEESSATTANAGQADSGTRAKEYSTTNVRQEGVDEADTAKTDGKYLYVLKDSRQEIAVVEAKDGSLKEYGSVHVEDGVTIEEFYLNAEKKKLVLVCSVYGGENGKATWDMGYDISTEAITYDVTEPSKPVEKGRVRQSGSYSSSRISGDYLYLFSTHYTGGNISREDKKSFVPLVNDKVMESGDIYLPPADMGCMYEVVTAVDIENPGEITDSKALFSQGGEIYVSNENIYYYETEWKQPDKTITTVRKIAYKDGRLKASAQGSFDGYLNDSFSIDEYNGYLRMVVTDGDTNAVYIMDDGLKIIGSIEGLAKDERIYSARFMGDIGYFVTFKETDPLYAVDLSNPEKPEIKGELKIPGFSDYLHFYGEDRLVGIGMAVDEKTLVTEGVKLTMFDISDAADVKEKDTYVLENVYSTDVSYDYKAALVDPEKNVIGFPGQEAGGRKYYLFSYDRKDGFKSLMGEEINGSAMMGARGIYIGDVLYIVQGNVIESYSLEDYKKISDIIL